MTPQSSLEHRIRQIIRQRLESLHLAGVQQLRKPPWKEPSARPPCAEEPACQTPITSQKQAAPVSTTSPAAGISSPPEPKKKQEKTSPRVAPNTLDFGISAPVSAEDRAQALARLRDEVAGCVRCSELARSRTQTVFGVGDPQTRLCFLGEAPGADEDRQGEPFVGAAGKLLNRIIAASQLKREEVYILNVLKCRPPGNRTPSVDEIANCRSFFERQLGLLQPEFICCLGLVATQSLLRTTLSLRRLRGRFHDYNGIRVMATYHPAYLLRNPKAKGDTWQDMKMLMREMGVDLG